MTNIVEVTLQNQFTGYSGTTLTWLLALQFACQAIGMFCF